MRARWRRRSRAAAGRSCRCTSCSRSRRGGSRAPRGRRSGPPWSRYSVTTFEPGASDVFTHGLRRQPARDGVAREQAGGEHHRRVRRVRAARDRGDDDVAVVELASATPSASAIGDARVDVPPRRAAAIASTGRRRCELGRAACRLVRARRRIGGRERQRVELDRVAELLVVVAVVGRQVVLRRRSGTPPARRSARRGPAGASARPATARPRRGRARSCRSRPARADSSSCHRPCSLAYASTSAMSSGGRPENSQVAQRLGVDREDRAGRAELRAHVADRRAVGERQAARGRGRRTRRTCRRRRARAASR